MDTSFSITFSRDQLITLRDALMYKHPTYEDRGVGEPLEDAATRLKFFNLFSTLTASPSQYYSIDLVTINFNLSNSEADVLLTYESNVHETDLNSAILDFFTKLAIVYTNTALNPVLVN